VGKYSHWLKDMYDGEEDKKSESSSEV